MTDAELPTQVGDVRRGEPRSMVRDRGGAGWQAIHAAIHAPALCQPGFACRWRRAAAQCAVDRRRLIANPKHVVPRRRRRADCRVLSTGIAKLTESGVRMVGTRGWL